MYLSVVYVVCCLMRVLHACNVLDDVMNLMPSIATSSKYQMLVFIQALTKG